MKILTLILRLLLGLMFVVFGSNAFLQFMPMPPMSGPAGDFIGALHATGYLKAIAAVQIAGGLLLLVGRFVPLGLTLLSPIVANIFLYHLFMDRNGLPIALVVSALTLFLIWCYRDAFASLLRAK